METGFFSKRERHLMQMWLWRQNNRERVNAHARRWRRENPERSAELSKQSRARHYQAFLAAQRRRQAKNPAKHAAKMRKWRKERPHVARAIGARRRASLLKATPAWVDLDAIRRVYELAAALGMQVDHIEPLQGPDACGLHVPWNLQLLTAKENQSKGNRVVRG